MGNNFPMGAPRWYASDDFRALTKTKFVGNKHATARSSVGAVCRSRRRRGKSQLLAGRFLQGKDRACPGHSSLPRWTTKIRMSCRWSYIDNADSNDARFLRQGGTTLLHSSLPPPRPKGEELSRRVRCRRHQTTSAIAGLLSSPDHHRMHHHRCRHQPCPLCHRCHHNHS